MNKAILYLIQYSDRKSKCLVLYNGLTNTYYSEGVLEDDGRLEEFLARNSRAWSYYNIYTGKQILDIKSYIRRQLK